MNICRISQWIQRYGGVTLSHTQDCAHCRAAARREASIEEALRGASRSVKVEPSPFLAGRIQANLSHRVMPPGMPVWNFARTLAFATVTCGAIGLTVWSSLSLHQAEKRAAQLAALTPLKAMVAKAAVVSPQEVILAGSELTRPLRLEMDKVKNDVRGAAFAVANEFLPASMMIADNR